MHLVKRAEYISGYKLLIGFKDGVSKIVDLRPHLTGSIFRPLKDIRYFKRFHVNPDIDTVVWDNDADFSPDFLYEIGTRSRNR